MWFKLNAMCEILTVSDKMSLLFHIPFVIHERLVFVGVGLGIVMGWLGV